VPNFNFPSPNDVAGKTPAIFCTAERVLALYNQDSGVVAQRLSQSVRNWFFQQAINQGWVGVHFLPEYPTNHGAGCVLWMPPKVALQTVSVQQNALVLVSSSQEE
jgi:hypothetical protein